MGRYAFFTTNFEYKFRFGVQESEDIRTFGGFASYEQYSQGYFTHHWELNDAKGILADLKALAEALGLTLPSFEEYELSLDGTQRLHMNLYNLYGLDPDEKTLSRFILGCLIYHQIHYENALSADYEG